MLLSKFCQKLPLLPVIIHRQQRWARYWMRPVQRSSCSLSHWLLLWKPYPLLVFLPEHHFCLGGIFTAEFKRRTSVGGWGGFSLLMLLSGLIIKLTWDRLTGAENQIYYICTYEGFVRIRDPRTNQTVKVYMQPWAKEKGGYWFRLQKAERQFTWRWRNKCLVNKCLLAYL